ncbi:protein kinase [Clostridium omnivorum]|uniref:Protein kinase n=1 Tax=Clostridium omnivorum TaxID=1604902 RepID=A0ABQ5N5D4_9CLOT|nr:protein kinase [Clostridium sp. E14]GLC30418.1 hypothetical protein bsdE14_18280 [Clostridium sp. E14]
MGGKHKHKSNYSDINLLDHKMLGRGHNGVVILLPDNKVIKICFNEKSFKGEAYILKKVNGNKYFPRIYEIGGNYMIRDYVDGVCMRDYIKHNGLSKELAKKIIVLLKEFEKLKFKKIDIRCKDIFIQPDGSLMIIDPKKCFSKERNFPRHLSKGLDKLGVLDYFLQVLKEQDCKLYKRWINKIHEYQDERKELDENY